MTVIEYLDAVKERLTADPLVAGSSIVRERVTLADGHLRARLPSPTAANWNPPSTSSVPPTSRLRSSPSYSWADADGNLILLRQLDEKGYKGRVVPIHHLRDLQEEIEDRYRQGLFDEEFYQERLAGFKFDPPEDLPEPRSLIMVAVPQPQIRFTFTWNGEPIPLIVPPTYLYWRETDRQVEELVAGILGVEGYRAVEVALPEKLLAARSGLGAYGRNNVCYVDGLGSFRRPVALVSDLPCPEDTWQEARMLERCQNCQACPRACPTGAIVAERFLLHAERCLTFRNEKPGSVPFPAWLDPAWHNCLVGCMICQRICPENKEFLGWIEEGTEFSAEETALPAGRRCASCTRYA